MEVGCGSSNGDVPQGRVWELVTEFAFVYPHFTLLCESSCLVGTSKIDSLT